MNQICLWKSDPFFHKRNNTGEGVGLIPAPLPVQLWVQRKKDVQLKWEGLKWLHTYAGIKHVTNHLLLCETSLQKNHMWPNSCVITAKYAAYYTCLSPTTCWSVLSRSGPSPASDDRSRTTRAISGGQKVGEKGPRSDGCRDTGWGKRRITHLKFLSEGSAGERYTQHAVQVTVSITS